MKKLNLLLIISTFAILIACSGNINSRLNNKFAKEVETMNNEQILGFTNSIKNDLTKFERTKLQKTKELVEEKLIESKDLIDSTLQLRRKIKRNIEKEFKELTQKINNDFKKIEIDNPQTYAILFKTYEKVIKKKHEDKFKEKSIKQEEEDLINIDIFIKIYQTMERFLKNKIEFINNKIYKSKERVLNFLINEKNKKHIDVNKFYNLSSEQIISSYECIQEETLNLNEIRSLEIQVENLNKRIKDFNNEREELLVVENELLNANDKSKKIIDEKLELYNKQIKKFNDINSDLKEEDKNKINDLNYNLFLFLLYKEIISQKEYESAFDNYEQISKKLIIDLTTRQIDLTTRQYGIDNLNFSSLNSGRFDDLLKSSKKFDKLLKLNQLISKTNKKEFTELKNELNEKNSKLKDLINEIQKKEKNIQDNKEPIISKTNYVQVAQLHKLRNEYTDLLYSKTKELKNNESLEQLLNLKSTLEKRIEKLKKCNISNKSTIEEFGTFYSDILTRLDSRIKSLQADYNEISNTRKNELIKSKEEVDLKIKKELNSHNEYKKLTSKISKLNDEINNFQNRKLLIKENGTQISEKVDNDKNKKRRLKSGLQGLKRIGIKINNKTMSHLITSCTNEIKDKKEKCEKIRVEIENKQNLENIDKLKKEIEEIEFNHSRDIDLLEESINKIKALQKLEITNNEKNKQAYKKALISMHNNLQKTQKKIKIEQETQKMRYKMKHKNSFLNINKIKTKISNERKKLLLNKAFALNKLKNVSLRFNDYKELLIEYNLYEENNEEIYKDDKLYFDKSITDDEYNDTIKKEIQNIINYKNSHNEAEYIKFLIRKNIIKKTKKLPKKLKENEEEYLSHVLKNQITKSFYYKYILDQTYHKYIRSKKLSLVPKNDQEFVFYHNILNYNQIKEKEEQINKVIKEIDNKFDKHASSFLSIFINIQKKKYMDTYGYDLKKLSNLIKYLQELNAYFKEQKDLPINEITNFINSKKISNSQNFDDDLLFQLNKEFNEQAKNKLYEVNILKKKESTIDIHNNNENKLNNAKSVEPISQIEQNKNKVRKSNNNRSKSIHNKTNASKRQNLRAINSNENKLNKAKSLEPIPQIDQNKNKNKVRKSKKTKSKYTQKKIYESNQEIYPKLEKINSYSSIDEELKAIKDEELNNKVPDIGQICESTKTYKIKLPIKERIKSGLKSLKNFIVFSLKLRFKVFFF